MGECKHMEFDANVVVNRLIDSGRFAAAIRIRCADCKVPFTFRGISQGLDTDGATMSLDGTEARLAIVPEGRPPKPFDGPVGYTIKIKE